MKQELISKKRIFPKKRIENETDHRMSGAETFHLLAGTAGGCWYFDASDRPDSTSDELMEVSLTRLLDRYHHLVGKVYRQVSL